MADIATVGSKRRSRPRQDRLAAREREMVRTASLVAATREAVKVDVIEEVTEAALVAASRISMVEALLAARTPSAEGRLRFIADAGVAGMANVVLGIERRL